MGRGRAPCCDKSKVKRGPWDPSEDLKLISFIRQHGHDNWRALPKLAGLSRCGKSCRLRWINYLRPDVKRGNFTKGEEETIIKLHQSFGNKWSKIASHLPGRTDNEIKNVWNTHLKKKLADSDGDESKQGSFIITSSSSSSSSSFAARRDSDMDLQEMQDPGHMDGPKDTAGRTGPQDKSSSSGSNVSNISSETGGAEKDEKCDSSLFFDVMEEVDKPETASGVNNVLEIPFEYDTDFWSMLDNLGESPIEATEIEQLLGVDDYRDSNLQGDEEISGGTENGTWLRYLENELELVEPPSQQSNDPKHPQGCIGSASL